MADLVRGGVDREQIRRPEERIARVDRAKVRRDARRYAHDAEVTILALLAELEQAERERDEAKHQRDNFERIAREQAETKHALWLWRNKNEPRLAKVPALVEATENFFSYMDNETYRSAPTFAEPFGTYFRALENALAEWERE